MEMQWNDVGNLLYCIRLQKKKALKQETVN